jgi:hypothetical protein
MAANLKEKDDHNGSFINMKIWNSCQVHCYSRDSNDSMNKLNIAAVQLTPEL